MSLRELKKSYDSLARKHSLPAFRVLNAAFAISTLDSSSISLYLLVKHIKSVLEERASFFENIIQPDSTITSVHELSVLTSNDKESCLRIIQKLMLLYRKAGFLLFDFSEDDAVVFIKNCVAVSSELKDSIKTILGKMLDSWEKDFKISSNDERYFG